MINEGELSKILAYMYVSGGSVGTVKPLAFSKNLRDSFNKLDCKIRGQIYQMHLNEQMKSVRFKNIDYEKNKKDQELEEQVLMLLRVYFANRVLFPAEYKKIKDNAQALIEYVIREDVSKHIREKREFNKYLKLFIVEDELKADLIYTIITGEKSKEKFGFEPKENEYIKNLSPKIALKDGLDPLKKNMKSYIYSLLQSKNPETILMIGRLLDYYGYIQLKRNPQGR